MRLFTCPGTKGGLAVRRCAGQVQLRTFLGLPGGKLIETTQRVNAQLIVLADRGSASMLLGTVSQYVLREAPCPVLVVPEASRDA